MQKIVCIRWDKYDQKMTLIFSRRWAHVLIASLFLLFFFLTDALVFEEIDQTHFNHNG